MPRTRDSEEDEVSKAGSGDEASEGGDSEPEFEIEAVLDHKTDVFGKGKEGFLVKWKGYDEAENSWVRPEDAGNAKELIEEFIKKRKKEKESASAQLKRRGRPSKASEPASTPTPSPQPAARRKSGAATASTKPAPAPAKKGRAEADEDDEEDESAPVTGKRGRKSNGATSAAGQRKKRQRTEESAEEDDDEGPVAVRPSEHARYKDRDSWEAAVINVETVERAGNKGLQVFFRMKGIQEPCVEDNEVCKQKFPQKLLSFYEKNLRWKIAEEDEAEQDD
ncbi:hypothetical protein K488DRAFT_79816 [Vararia minispora EC-137]|uniref:Uncharacterized protein n=1 Tax=Vararia minispora EC-137 TaxID=1314806 RepID=A0ACB8QEE4_9AGAM|nr:hypothetical protein K488DRAFT_79816 [Vararia minispora EC-137]